MIGATTNTRKGVIFIFAALALSGCAASAPYKDALGRFQTTGRAIESHLKPAADESVKALYDAFHAAINEPIK